MTVVAVLKESDAVLYIGADSQWTDSEGLKNFKTKLTVMDGLGNVIVWATAGNPQIGFTEFGDWARGHQRTTNESWQTFIEEVAVAFARLNGVRKRIGEAAGEDVSSSDFLRQKLCTMLICGWINGENGAYFVGHDGAFQSINSIGKFLTIGTGSSYAEAVYGTLRYFRKRLLLSDEQLFQHTMQLTSRYGNQCSLPYEYIKLSSGELSRFQSKEPEPGVEEITPASQSDR